MSNNVYQIITDKIVAKLEEGAAPWSKPWKVTGAEGAPRNLKSGKAYRGINVFLLSCQGYESPYWLTFKQAKAKGGSVRKGEKGTQVVFWKWIEKKSTDGDEPERFPILRYYTVFNVEQCDGVDYPKAKAEPVSEFEAIAAAELVVENMRNRPEITHGGDRACYSPTLDVVKMPKREAFKSPAEYYSTLFHELAHSTGHESRVGRPFGSSFGSEKYGKEELVAEMTAAMVAGHVGIEDATIDNSAAYLASWIKTLKGDPKMAVCAAAQAQKAADYILGVAFENGSDE
jgi:antirestriction protein ArdC